MRGKKLVAGVLALLLFSLTACGDYDEVNALRSISALNSESSVTNSYSLSYTDEQNMIYAQVSNRQLLDLSTLDACTDNELQQVINYMNSVDNQLSGAANDDVIDSQLTDYLLAEFEKTPYYWQRTKTIVRGIDAESRSIVVDVQYRTIGFAKEVKGDSTIVRGEPDYLKKLEVRFSRWLSILAMRYNNPTNPLLPSMESDFLLYYGDPQIIIDEQRTLTPTESIYETGNQTTYTGMIDSEQEQSGGTMTVRFILVPNYVLGVNLGITCQHMYITEFKLDNDCTEGLSLFTDEGYATVTDSVYGLIHSYFQCIDESDFEGLYKLTNNFRGLDKYYEDMFETSYRKHEGYSVSLFNIIGTHITCGVEISSKVRAKGANMTMPIYTDRYYMELSLEDGVLVVDNMVHLSRRLEGEPAITTDDADTAGFVASIDLNNDDKLKIEKLICDFGGLQLLGDTTSDNFADVVDLSMSSSQLSSLQTNMTMLSGVQKVVWLQNYQQGTSNYASVKCRELFQDATNAIVEASTTYDFIMKGGQWYVYGYDVNSSVRLDTTNLSTTGSLCLLEPGKTVAYTSQVQATASTNLDTVSDTSVTYDHPEHEPILKSGNIEQGYNKLTAEEVTDEIFNNEVATTTANMSAETYRTLLLDLMDLVGEDEVFAEVIENYQTAVMEGIAYLYNSHNNLFIDDAERLAARDGLPALLDDTRAAMSRQLANLDRDTASQYTGLAELLQAINVVLQRI